MKHPTPHVNPELVALAHTMADSASVILKRYFLSDFAIEHKSDNSPVTKVDREVEQALRQLITSHFPDHGIFGEEFGRVNESSPWQWVLDPIDGTHAFIAGEPTFTTLIALTKDGVPVLGVINQPTQDERWLGVAGAPTTLDGKNVTTRSTTSLKDATIATTAMKYFKPDQVEIYERLQAVCAAHHFGGDAYLYAGLASGKYDLVVEAGLKPYDFCALRPVVEGAGGIITDWNGAPLTLQSDGRVLACANQSLHAAALQFLAQQ